VNRGTRDSIALLKNFRDKMEELKSKAAGLTEGAMEKFDPEL